MVYIHLMCVIVLWGSAHSLWGDARPLPSHIPDRVFAFATDARVSVGDAVTYTIQVDTDPAASVSFPSHAAQIGGLDITRIEHPDTTRIGSAKYRHTQQLTLTPYTAGAYIIPSQNIRIAYPSGQSQQYQTPDIFVDVASVLDPNSDTLKDIVPPLRPPIKIPYTGIAVGVLALALLIVCGIIYIKKRRQFRHMSQRTLSSYDIAQKELQRIQSLQLIEAKKIKEFYYLVSQCLRRYIESVCHINAPEQTTEEFLDHLRHSHSLTDSERRILHDYLHHCDLVKYARLSATHHDCRRLIDTTALFIKQSYHRTTDTAS